MYKQFRKSPDSLCRIPLFLPIKDRESVSNKIFECRWGKVTFPTFPLTVFDEEVFLACVNESVYLKEHDRLYYADRSVYDLTREMGKKTSGAMSKRVMNSLLAIGNTPVEIEIKKPAVSFSGTLAEVIITEPNKPVEVIFHKDLSSIMKHNRTEKANGTLRNIDMVTRGELCTTGKAIHRFMCGHQAVEKGEVKPYKFSIEVLHDAVAPHMRIDNFREVLRQTLYRLKELKFLMEGDIGRNNGTEMVMYSRSTKADREDFEE